MTRTDISHWSALWRALGAQGEPGPWHRRLVAAYSESTRRYHTLQHLSECLCELDAHRALASHPLLVEVALWFHDAFYDTYSALNEEDSAQLATDCLAGAGIDHAAIDEVRRLIVCTKGHELGTNADTALLIDIDLAILGQPPARFWDYEAAIRAEYAWVPIARFAHRRTEILARFLQRPAIYRTEPLRAKYEAPARANLRAAIERLQRLPP